MTMVWVDLVVETLVAILPARETAPVDAARPTSARDQKGRISLSIWERPVRCHTHWRLRMYAGPAARTAEKAFAATAGHRRIPKAKIRSACPIATFAADTNE
jgi:hypothetical protein